MQGMPKHPRRERWRSARTEKAPARSTPVERDMLARIMPLAAAAPGPLLRRDPRLQGVAPLAVLARPLHVDPCGRNTGL